MGVPALPGRRWPGELAAQDQGERAGGGAVGVGADRAHFEGQPLVGGGVVRGGEGDGLRGAGGLVDLAELDVTFVEAGPREVHGDVGRAGAVVEDLVLGDVELLGPAQGDGAAAAGGDDGERAAELEVVDGAGRQGGVLLVVADCRGGDGQLVGGGSVDVVVVVRLDGDGVLGLRRDTRPLRADWVGTVPVAGDQCIGVAAGHDDVTFADDRDAVAGDVDVVQAPGAEVVAALVGQRRQGRHLGVRRDFTDVGAPVELDLARLDAAGAGVLAVGGLVPGGLRGTTLAP